MKYSKPELHSISALNADAICTNGSDASPVPECTVGVAVKAGRCNSGGVPSMACTIGTAPATCAAGGNVGVSCVAGNNPV